MVSGYTESPLIGCFVGTANGDSPAVDITGSLPTPLLADGPTGIVLLGADDENTGLL